MLDVVFTNNVAVIREVEISDSFSTSDYANIHLGTAIEFPVSPPPVLRNLSKCDHSKANFSPARFDWEL